MIIPFANKTLCPIQTERYCSVPAPLMDVVIHYAQPEKVYLLGYIEHQQSAWSIFAGQRYDTSRVNRYYMLLVCRKAIKEQFLRIRDQIEQKAMSITPVTVLILAAEELINLIEQGNRFAIKIAERHSVLYDRCTVSLPLVGQKDLACTLMEIKSCYTSTCIAGREFLAGAKLFEVRQQYKFAAFMLHQAVEQLLRGWVEISIGYRCVTHNLYRLLIWAVLCSPEMETFFKLHSSEDEDLFKLLQSAYSDARYRKYQIRGDQLALLIERVDKLISWYSDAGAALLNKL